MPVPEDKRHTVQVKLRLKPEVVRDIDKRRGQESRSDWISRMILGLSLAGWAKAKRALKGKGKG